MTSYFHLLPPDLRLDFLLRLSKHADWQIDDYADAIDVLGMKYNWYLREIAHAGLGEEMQSLYKRGQDAYNRLSDTICTSSVLAMSSLPQV